jgi:hypothetical protein
MEPKKPGRKSKGDRCQVNTLQPRALVNAAAAKAARHGMTLTDYVGQLLADDLGMTYQAQEALSLSA